MGTRADEVVFGDRDSLPISNSDDSLSSGGGVMSEKVQGLASGIYEEFQRLIKVYGDDVVKEIMPLVVGVLEALEQSVQEKNEIDVEQELLKDDKEQLLKQFEKERNLRKSSEQRCMEIEDMNFEERKELNNKIESMESILRMLELKARNSSDHVTRLEDKEADMRKEYQKLHDRYTELFRTHCEYMERTKFLIGNDKIMESSQSSAKSPVTMAAIAMQRRQTSGGSEPASSATLDGAQQLDNSIPFVDASSSPYPIRREQKAIGARDLQAELNSSQTLVQGTATTSSSIFSGEPFGGIEQLEDSFDYLEQEDSELPEVTESTPARQPSSLGDAANDSGPPSSLALNQLTFGADDDLTGKISYDLSEYSTQSLSPNDDDGGKTDDDELINVNSEEGVGREVEKLIAENAELLETKNALNIVKDDLIAKVDEYNGELEIQRREISSLRGSKLKLETRIMELESELKAVKEDIENKRKEEDEIPINQRKRFTRIEMARVLMERNQYKERLMELQEAVRWTEMIRASREHPDVAPQSRKGRSGVWSFFGGLFGSPSKHRKPVPAPPLRYNAPSSKVKPLSDTSKRTREALNAGDKQRAYSFMNQPDAIAKQSQDRSYSVGQSSAVKAQIIQQSEDGRFQAYGWSLPSEFQLPKEKTQMPVPVPVFCSPLVDSQPGCRIWCGAAVKGSGHGRRKDGSSVFAASTFYGVANKMKIEQEEADTSIDNINSELKEHEMNLKLLEEEEEECSSLVWLCSTTHSESRVQIIDLNTPSEVIESFPLPEPHILCICGVPGSKPLDFDLKPDTVNKDAILIRSNKQAISPDVPEKSFSDEKCSAETLQFLQSVASSTISTEQSEMSETEVNEAAAKQTKSSAQDVAGYLAKSGAIDVTSSEADKNGAGTSKQDTVESSNAKSKVDSLPSSPTGLQETMSTVMPTMWLAGQSGTIYIHSAAARWSQCIDHVKLKDSVISLIHVRGRVFAALADGSVAMFHRASEGEWSLHEYHLIELGSTQPVRCLANVANRSIWCGHGNKIVLLNPSTFDISKSFEVHPSRDSQVRRLVPAGDGVWVSMHLDSILRLYHAYTQEHLQDIDIEPCVAKILGAHCDVGFSLIRISTLLVTQGRLWVGTGNGVIVSLPFCSSVSEANSAAGSPTNRPGAAVRVYSDDTKSSGSVLPATFTPYVQQSHAQLSFHGHKDAVKLFISVPGVNTQSLSAAAVANRTPMKNILILSAGEGSVDFRIVDADEAVENGSSASTNTATPQLITKQPVRDLPQQTHLILWQLTVARE